MSRIIQPLPHDNPNSPQDTGSIGVGSEELRILIADVTNAASLGDMLSGAMRRGGGSFSPNDCSTQFANARLIAAAPELLDALKSMVRRAQKQGWQNAYPEELSAAEAAIAKAEAN